MLWGGEISSSLKSSPVNIPPQDCVLILTEGDSAKSLAMSGLGVIGKDKFGVFPLRGKLLNVREASHKQVCVNL